LPANAIAQASGAGAATPTADNPLGIVVEELTAEQRQQLGIDDDEGVVVTHVVGSAARRAALAPGDVILMVGRKPVGSVADFNAAIKRTPPGQSVMLLVRRDDITSFIAIEVPKTAKD
jgi:serine protease Do